MAFPEIVLAVLRRGPAHGYSVKHEHDLWFPDARPVAFGQVYSTLARLQRDGLVEIADTCAGGGPERTVYAITSKGDERLAAWLAEPSPGDSPYGDEIVRKTVAALRTGAVPNDFLALQRTAHLRRIRELTSVAADEEPASRLARDHLVAHLDADLRWLDLAVERIAAGTP